MWGKIAAGAALMSLASGPVVAQTTPEELRKEFAEMRRAYDAELQRMRRDYEGRIRQLEERARRLEAGAAGGGTTSPVPAPGRAPPPAQVGSAPASSAAAPPTAAQASAGGQRLLSTPGRDTEISVKPRAPRSADASFNPAIGLVLDGRFAVFENNPANYTIPGIQFPAARALATRA